MPPTSYIKVNRELITAQHSLAIFQVATFHTSKRVTLMTATTSNKLFDTAPYDAAEIAISDRITDFSKYNSCNTTDSLPAVMHSCNLRISAMIENDQYCAYEDDLSLALGCDPIIVNDDNRAYTVPYSGPNCEPTLTKHAINSNLSEYRAYAYDVDDSQEYFICIPGIAYGDDPTLTQKVIPGVMHMTMSDNGDLYNTVAISAAIADSLTALLALDLSVYDDRSSTYDGCYALDVAGDWFLEYDQYQWLIESLNFDDTAPYKYGFTIDRHGNAKLIIIHEDKADHVGAVSSFSESIQAVYKLSNGMLNRDLLALPTALLAAKALADGLSADDYNDTEEEEEE